MRRRHTVRAGRSFRIPGWSVGYHDEISSHAAIRTLDGAKDMLFVMTTVDDREPRSLDEQVVVGLYRFDGDEWEQIGYRDFNDVSAVLRMTDAQLRRVLEAS